MDIWLGLCRRIFAYVFVPCAGKWLVLVPPAPHPHRQLCMCLGAPRSADPLSCCRLGTPVLKVCNSNGHCHQCIQDTRTLSCLHVSCAGTSRLVLANLEHLPIQCKPGHRPIAAAVLECFASSRVTVRKCKVSVTPGRASSKAGLDCRVMHAQGHLQGQCVGLVCTHPACMQAMPPQTLSHALLDAQALGYLLLQLFPDNMPRRMLHTC
jgi:hypothetical protein